MGANGVFVAVARDGFPNQVMTSGALAGGIGEPESWLVVRQSLPMPQNDDCLDIDDISYEWGTGLSGGWIRAWEPWVNTEIGDDGQRIGGWACSRVLINKGLGWSITHS